jgi:hypothetical protein
MAKLKSEMEKCVSLSERDYLTLIEDHLMLKALKIAGIEELPMYKAAISILEDARVEVHLKPVKAKYK